MIEPLPLLLGQDPRRLGLPQLLLHLSPPPLHLLRPLPLLLLLLTSLIKGSRPLHHLATCHLHGLVHQLVEPLGEDRAQGLPLLLQLGVAQGGGCKWRVQRRRVEGESGEGGEGAIG